MVKLVPLDLGDGQKRLLKFEADGIILFEENNGNRSITEIFGAVPTLRLVLLLLWSGLYWSDQTLTFDETKKLFNEFHERTGKSYMDLVAPIIEALRYALIRDTSPKPNGHDVESPPNVLTEAVQREPSPTGFET